MAMDLFSKFKRFSNENLKISVKDNYPITIENEHIGFIIAPRGED